MIGNYLDWIWIDAPYATVAIWVTVIGFVLSVTLLGISAVLDFMNVGPQRAPKRLYAVGETVNVLPEKIAPFVVVSFFIGLFGFAWGIVLSILPAIIFVAVACGLTAFGVWLVRAFRGSASNPREGRTYILPKESFDD